MKISTPQDLFAIELANIYISGKRLLKILPDMIRATSNQALRKNLEFEKEDTKKQLQRLEKVYEILNISHRKGNGDAIDGLIEEVEELIEDTRNDSVRDSALIIALQKIKHYEIATYGSLCALAKGLGYTQAAEILQESLDLEKQEDKTLSLLAINDINPTAMAQQSARKTG